MKDLLMQSIRTLIRDHGMEAVCRALACQATDYYEGDLKDGEEPLGADFAAGCRRLWEAVGLFHLENRIQKANRKAQVK
jgi:hypothetical protein